MGERGDERGVLRGEEMRGVKGGVLREKVGNDDGIMASKGRVSGNLWGLFGRKCPHDF